MNRKIIFAMAIALMAAGTASAQNDASKSAIKVKKGTKFSYSTTSDMEMTQSMMGQEMTISGKTTVRTELTAKKVDKSQIEWVMAIPQLRMTMTNPMSPEGSVDTTIKPDPQTYITDLSGRVLHAAEPSEASQMQMMVGGSIMKNFALWFTPELPKGAQSGVSWEDNRRDTMNMSGIEIISSQNLKYTYDGVTDTLGVKVARIRWSATSMKIEGGGNVEGNEMKIDGDGALSGVSYYSTKDGMLYASTTDSESNMRLGINAGGQERVIPVVQTAKISIMRQK